MSEGDPVQAGRPCTEPVGWYTRDGRLRGTERPVPGKCGRKLRGTDPPRYCGKDPAAGHDACRLHGSRARSGMAHRDFKHGRFSRYFPKGGLKKAYERAASDRELISLRDDLALIEARQVEILESFGKAPAPPWEGVPRAMEDLRAATDAGDRRRFEAAFAALEAVVRDGAGAARAQALAWKELRDLIAQKTRTAAAEVKRLVVMRQMLTKERIAEYVYAMAEAVRRNVTDPATLNAIQRDLNVLIGVGGPAAGDEAK